MNFSIVIPAYNEERAIEAILRRGLEAARRIESGGLGIERVELIVVDDGSRDSTGELARRFPEVRVITHPRNLGYGAAIKTGFGQAEGEWLGFLDADGTCDPQFFAELLKLANERGLDIAVGSRMHGASKMPAVRRLGNWCFRALVNLISGSHLADVASGMRVLKRSALAKLEPLPDGLNFTPAMSVRAALEPGLKTGEIPMPYEERVGRSKLSVARDGLRFLEVILDTAITFRPLFFFGVGAMLAAGAGLWALASRWGAPEAPLFHYLRHRRIEEWMLFRIIFVVLLFSTAAFLASLGAVAQSMVSMLNRDDRVTSWQRWAEAAIARHFLWWGFLFLAASLWLNRGILASYWATGQIPIDQWVFPLVGSLLALVGVELVAFGLMERILRLLRERGR